MAVSNVPGRFGSSRWNDCEGKTYGLVLDLLGLALLEGEPVTLVLQTLRRNEALDLGSLGVRLLALTLGLDLATNDVLADLISLKRLQY